MLPDWSTYVKKVTGSEPLIKDVVNLPMRQGLIGLIEDLSGVFG